MLFAFRKGDHVRLNEERIREAAGGVDLITLAKHRTLLTIIECYWTHLYETECIVVGYRGYHIFAKYFEQDSVCSLDSDPKK